MLCKQSFQIRRRFRQSPKISKNLPRLVKPEEDPRTKKRKILNLTFPAYLQRATSITTYSSLLVFLFKFLLSPDFRVSMIEKVLTSDVNLPKILLAIFFPIRESWVMGVAVQEAIFLPVHFGQGC